MRCAACIGVRNQQHSTALTGVGARQRGRRGGASGVDAKVLLAIAPVVAALPHLVARLGPTERVLCARSIQPFT